MGKPKELMVQLMKKSGPLSEDGGDESLFLHKAIVRSMAVLDRLATAAKLPALSSYVSEDPDNVYDLVDDEDEADELLAKRPPVRFSQPADALPTVLALIAQCQGNKPPAEVKDHAQVVAELRDLETILNTAASKRATFRLYHEF